MAAMGRVTLRNVMSHKLRLALTAIAVVLGVSFVAGTLIFTDTMSKSFDDLFNKIGKHIAVEVRPTKALGGDDNSFDRRGTVPPLPASLISTIGKVDGVSNVQGQVSGYAGVIGKDGKVISKGGAPQIGGNWTHGGSYSIKAGRAPGAQGEVALDQDTAKTAGVGVGGTVRVVTSNGPVLTEQVVGIIDTGNLQGTTYTAFDTATAQKLLLRPGYFNDITMSSSGPSETVLRDRVAQALPPGYEAVTGTKVRDENKSALQSLLSFFRTFLLVFAFISIFVGAFIIFNTFSMLVAQRTRELALLRAIGASRKQVTRAVIGEAILVGFLGSSVGIGLGVGLASLLQSLFNAGKSPLVITATPFVWSYVVGILVTVISAYFPARRAAKIPPVAAMRDDVALPQRSLRIRLAIGSVLTACGAVLMILGIGGATGQPLALLGAGAGGVFLGVAMLAPVISRPVVRVLGGLYPKIFRTPGRLAQQNAMRNPRRTAATAAALMIGLALVTTINVMSATMKSSLGHSVDTSFGADYIVEPSGSAGPFGPSALKAVQDTPGVTSATGLYQAQAKVDGKKVNYVSGDPAGLARAVKLKMVSGSLDVGQDGILVQEDVAKTNHYTVGSTMQALFPDHRTQQVRVAGIYAKNDFLGNRLFGLPIYRAHTDPAQQLLTIIAINAGKADSATKQALEHSLRDYPTLKVDDQSDVKKQFEGQVDQLTSLLTMLLAMSLVIAAVGVINTLALSVIERTREIGLLRAVGTSRRQVRRMIRLESIVIAVFGAVLGIGIGLAFGVAIQHGLRDQGLNILSIPVGTLVVYLVLAGLIGVLAALWPAWRAGRMDVLKAIGTE
jgi:putative ABC transport system permease protein